MSSEGIEKQILNRKARIGILGLGYVGLPLGIEFAIKGFRVSGFDVDQNRLASLRKGRSYVSDVDSQVLSDLIRSRRFIPQRHFRDLASQDAVIICVPTPLRKSKDPDVSYILSAAEQVRRYLRKGQIIVLESTTYPGTTRELVLPLLEETGFRIDRDFYLAFSPERVDPGNKIYRIPNTPKVVGGLTPSSTRIASVLYRQIVEQVIPVSNADAAEMVKLLENTFRAVNIGLINEMALMCHRLNLDVWEIIEAASSKPFGFMPFYPGPGLGGHCIPIDPHYLAWKMKALNFEPRFIELAGVINSSMPHHVVYRLAQLLNFRGAALKKSRILILGVAYKKDVSDYRESPALDVMQLLLESEADVFYHDPFVPSLMIQGKRFLSQKMSSHLLKSMDGVVILTAHSGLNYEWIIKNSCLVFDTRHAARGLNASHLFRL